MFSPKLAPFMNEEFKEKHISRKSRKQVNTTTRNELEYVKKKFIYHGNFLVLCGISFGIYVILIFSIQIWILISRIEIRNGVRSLSSAEETTWWFDQVVIDF
uniref:Delta-like protein n=1 Tax=Elaeophora elaphi TaxID=1147741 RepID=A0A0R3RYE5_9BILA